MYEEKLLPLQCTSVFAPCMADFVEQKRALGNKYNACVEVFNGFDRFCNEQRLESPVISKELLSLWEEKRPHENETTQLVRISYVRQFCEYLNKNGYEVPGAFHPAPKKSQQFVPYIFTKNELEKLFSATDATKPTPLSPIRHLVMPVLFRLIYTCGLRASEALRLKVSDVDLDQGMMTIFGAKGDKDRMVGISDSMLEYMRNYRANPMVAVFDSEFFFPRQTVAFMIPAPFMLTSETISSWLGFPTVAGERDLVFMTCVIPLLYMCSTNGAAREKICTPACRFCGFTSGTPV